MNNFCPFVIFLLAIVLSVLLRILITLWYLQTLLDNCYMCSKASLYVDSVILVMLQQACSKFTRTHPYNLKQTYLHGKLCRVSLQHIYRKHAAISSSSLKIEDEILQQMFARSYFSIREFHLYS
jgi:hypothetical protein